MKHGRYLLLVLTILCGGAHASVGSGGLANSSLSSLGKSMSDMFVNLSAEYPALLDAVFIVFGAAGVMISCWGVLEILKMGKRDQLSYSPANVIMLKFLGGASLIDLAFWGKVWTATLWDDTDPLGIQAYSASSGGDNSKVALMAALGIIVIAGYIVLGRAYIMTTRLGYLSPDARSDLIGNIIARIVAGSIMIACLHFGKAFEASAGFDFIPN